MSAYQVSHDHIDAMLTVAGQFPSSPFSWEGKGGEWHRFDGARADREERTQIGQMLLLENFNSVKHLYPKGPLPGTIGQTFENYQFRPVMQRLTIVSGLKLTRCYVYQACEHEEWEQSEAYRFCDSLTVALIAELPGIEGEFNRPEVLS